MTEIDRVQINFYIRLKDRSLWITAKEKAADNDKILYEVITDLLREWVTTNDWYNTTGG